MKTRTTLMMCAALLGAAPVGNAYGHVHCLCGNGTCSIEGHYSHKDETWREWTGTNSLPVAQGCWFLTNDVVLASTWMPSNGVNLCLNGNVVRNAGQVGRMAEIKNNARVVLTDCRPDVEHYFIVTNSGERLDNPTYVYTTEPSLATRRLYGGCWIGCDTWKNGDNRKGFLVSGANLSLFSVNLVGHAGPNSGTVMTVGGGRATLCNTHVVGNYSSGGAIENGGEFIMTHGSIRENSAQYSPALRGPGSRKVLRDVDIVENMSLGNLSAIFAESRLDLRDCRILGNRSLGGGGGAVYAHTNVVVTIGGRMDVYDNYCKCTRNGLEFSREGSERGDFRLDQGVYLCGNTNEPLLAGSRIGVMPYRNQTPTNAPLTVATNCLPRDVAYFRADQPRAGVIARSNTLAVVMGKQIDAAAWMYVEDGTCTVYGQSDLHSRDTPGTSALWNNRAAITNLVIADGVTGIGANFCSYIKGLRSLTIGDSVTNVAQDAFLFCTGLTNITIGAGVESIGSNAFARCNSLETVRLARLDIPGARDAFKLTARITMNGDRPVIDTVPKMEVDGFRLVLKGCAALNEEWEIIEDETNIPERFHFFTYEFEPIY